MILRSVGRPKREAQKASGERLLGMAKFLDCVERKKAPEKRDVGTRVGSKGGGEPLWEKLLKRIYTTGREHLRRATGNKTSSASRKSAKAKSQRPANAKTVLSRG